MDIQTEKLGLIQWITRLNDKELVDQLKKIMDAYLEQSLADITEEEKASVKRGVEDFKMGRIHSHETAQKVYEKYL